MFASYPYPACEVSSPIGKLSEIQESAGKVRVVALLDPFTQWLLYPLHNQFFTLFRRIEMDGTHDQVKPLKSLMLRLKEKGQKDVFSFDLSAATDRLPRWLNVAILEILLTKDIAEAWEEILTGRTYEHTTVLNPANQKTRRVISQSLKYRVGQPMGAYSSWAMLNITHHLIVQWAYHRAYDISPDFQLGTDWFEDYAVLGDDIVIGNKRVADEYLVILDLLGAPVNLSKSLVSNNGSAEFAKRFFLRYQDASPISFKELLVARRALSVALELCNKALRFRKDNISILLDVFGRKHVSKSKVTGAISGLSTELGNLVLGWLTRHNEFDLVALTQKSLYNTRPSVLTTKPLRRIMFGKVHDALKASFARMAIYGYESNYMDRLASVAVEFVDSKAARFLFRTRFASVIYHNYYKIVAEMRRIGKNIEKRLETLQRRSLWSPGCPEKELGEVEFYDLVQMKYELDALRDSLPRNLNVREEEATLRLYSSRITFARSLRAKTKRFVNRTNTCKSK